MSNTANVGHRVEDYTPLADPNLKDRLNYNQRQKAGKLVRQIQHKANYGLAIYAQQLLKIEDLQKQLTDLGLPPVDVVTPDLSDHDKLVAYAEASNYKAN